MGNLEVMCSRMLWILNSIGLAWAQRAVREREGALAAREKAAAEAGRAAEDRAADLAGRAAAVEAAEAAAAGRAQAQAELQEELDALRHGLAQRGEDLDAAEAEVPFSPDMCFGLQVFVGVLIDK